MSKQLITLAFGVFVILAIALAGAFTEIIKAFTSAMGFYGFIIGVLIVIAIIAGLLGVKK